METEEIEVKDQEDCTHNINVSHGMPRLRQKSTILKEEHIRKVTIFHIKFYFSNNQIWIKMLSLI